MTPAVSPPTIGLRHVALRVRDLAGVERFFVSLLGYRVEWRPDDANVYLIRHQDNVALHRVPGAAGPGLLSVEVARDAVLAAAQPTGTERVDIDHALGRVAAERAVARISLPPCAPATTGPDSRGSRRGRP